MASGKPVIATPVDGTKEAVVEYETGLFVPIGDSNHLERAISQLLENPELAKKLGQNGRRRVERHFSLKKQVESFEKLYSSFV